MSNIYHVAAPGICLDDCVSKGHDCCPIFRKQITTKTIECKAGYPRQLWKAE
jgi:hypothetical protein